MYRIWICEKQDNRGCYGERTSAPFQFLFKTDLNENDRSHGARGLRYLYVNLSTADSESKTTLIEVCRPF